MLGLLGPLFAEEKLKVLVAKGSRCAGPRAPESRGSGVAAAKSMCSTESYNFLVVETHAVKDVTEVVFGVVLLVASISVRQQSVGKIGVRLGLVSAAKAEGKLGPSHLLNSYIARERPQVTVGDLGVVCLYRLKKSTSFVQACVCAPLALGSKTHSGAIASAHLVVLIVGTSVVPGQAHQDRSVRSVVMVLVLEKISNFLLDLVNIWDTVLLIVVVVPSCSRASHSQQAKKTSAASAALGGCRRRHSPSCYSLLCPAFLGDAEAPAAGIGPATRHHAARHCCANPHHLANHYRHRPTRSRCFPPN
mmetsp:Transcript_17455/g.30771  ORF Transcript_17455/g.30771 Transcript_17455/m.30771 type:complete len:305 (-) Transcript_17455:78-992(-)